MLWCWAEKYRERENGETEHRPQTLYLQLCCDSDTQTANLSQALRHYVHSQVCEAFPPPQEIFLFSWIVFFSVKWRVILCHSQDAGHLLLVCHWLLGSLTPPRLTHLLTITSLLRGPYTDPALHRHQSTCTSPSTPSHQRLTHARIQSHRTKLTHKSNLILTHQSWAQAILCP